jgi:DNA replication factor GINS
MDIEELRAVQTRERSSSDLQELRESFYADVAEYLEGLRTERDRLAAEREDPYDDEVIRVNDEIDAAQRVVESIHERRVGKVVQQASFAANGMGDVPEGLTAEERALFEDLVERIQSNRERVLEIVSGDTSAAATGPSAPSGSDGRSEAATQTDTPDDEEVGEDESSAAALMDEGVTDGGAGTSTDHSTDSQHSEQPAPKSDECDLGSEQDDSSTDAGASMDRERVRITSEVGEIFGLDERVYDLRQEDVVTLPTENAGPLVERGAAERLE